MLLFYLITLLLTTSTLLTKPRVKQIDQSLNDKQFSSDQSCVLIEQCKYCSFSEIKKISECQMTGYVSIQKCWKNNQQDVNDKYIYLEYRVCQQPHWLSTVQFFILACMLGLALSLEIFRRQKQKIEQQFYQKVVGKTQI